jgi:hypothetical protein
VEPETTHWQPLVRRVAPGEEPNSSEGVGEPPSSADVYPTAASARTFYVYHPFYPASILSTLLLQRYRQRAGPLRTNGRPSGARARLKSMFYVVLATCVAGESVSTKNSGVQTGNPAHMHDQYVVQYANSPYELYAESV